MDMNQTVEIPLQEYLELQELKKHEKYVKYEDTTIHFHNGKATNQSTTEIEWKSDGATWSAVVQKQKMTARRLENVHRSLTRFFINLGNMSLRDLLRLRKEVRKLQNSERKGGDEKAVNYFIEGWD